jgi:beta-phosphoglucomutase-like phosphatase (HAD superfamily)
MLDCDNTLVQSERFAFEACADLTNIVMEKHNIDARYTAESLLEDFVGHNFRGMLKGLQQKHNFTMPEDEMEDFVQQELGAVTRKLSQKAVECPGVTDELNKLKEQGYPMSVVSTSAKSRVVASIEKAGIAHFFPPEHVYSAATSLDPPSSKPDPAIYLYAAEQLGIYGIEEGKEKMEQMAKLLTEETKCAAIMYDWKEFQECLKKVEAKL